MAGPIRIGVVGVGKIARDQHLPAIRANPDYQLAASASRSATVEGLPGYVSLTEMLDGQPELDAVALCTPPQVRYGLAVEALSRGKHVLLEKPPASTLSEIEDLKAIGERSGRTLFATWHARYAPLVERAREWLAGRKIASARIDWREDVRRWHPGQQWIWDPGGMGVFDPGINALSIATNILPKFFFSEGVLRFPENRQAPIAADLKFHFADGLEMPVGLDWLQTGPQTWDIRVGTDGGELLLSLGGSRMEVDGELAGEAPEAEYPGLYARFAELIGSGVSDVDVSPLRHVADAFLSGRREIVEAFNE
ncbi:MAG TPA: Gfo/Idh/MocA family oxidoreductase [Caulobacteraceae bacterium]|jgi:D-galactose 1-dehydrogenase